MTRRNQLLVLSGLVGLWAVIVIGQIVTTSPQQEVPLRFVSGNAAPTTQLRNAASDGFDIRATRPRVNRAHRSPSKNIFAPLDRPSPPPKVLLAKTRRPNRSGSVKSEEPLPKPPISSPPLPIAQPQPSPEQVAALLLQQKKEAEIQEARAQLSQYRLLGYLLEKGSEEAYLAKGRDIFIVHSGETIEKRIYVASILESGITLRETMSNLEVTLQPNKID